MSLPVVSVFPAPSAAEPEAGSAPPARDAFAARLEASVGAEAPRRGVADGPPGAKPRRRRLPGGGADGAVGLGAGAPVLPFPGPIERAAPTPSAGPLDAPPSAGAAGTVSVLAVERRVGSGPVPPPPAALVVPPGPEPVASLGREAEPSVSGPALAVPTAPFPVATEPLAPLERPPAPRRPEAEVPVEPWTARTSPPAAWAARPGEAEVRPSGRLPIEAPLEALLPPEIPPAEAPSPSEAPAAWRVEPPTPPPPRGPGARARREPAAPSDPPPPGVDPHEAGDADPGPGPNPVGAVAVGEDDGGEIPFLGLVGGPAPREAPEVPSAPALAPLPEPPPDAGVPTLALPVPDRIEVRVDDPRGAWELSVHREGDRLALVVRAGAEVREVVRQGEGELRERLAAEGTPLGELSLQHHGSPSYPERRAEVPEPVATVDPRPRRPAAEPVSATAPHRSGRLLDRDA